MRFSVLSSGSKGNCTYLEINGKKILIDVGIANGNIVKKLDEIGVDYNLIDYVFITHAHSDHVCGLQVFCKKNNSEIFVCEEMLKDIKFDFKYELLEDSLYLDGINIEVLKLSHDFYCVGYKFSFGDKSLCYITDTGYLNKKYFAKLSNLDAYIFESNHDINMLMEHDYPYYTKQRIRGDIGHLSNEDASKHLCSLIGDKTKSVVLAHVSDNSNTYELACETLINKLKDKKILFDNVKVAKQNEVLEFIVI